MINFKIKVLIIVSLFIFIVAFVLTLFSLFIRKETVPTEISPTPTSAPVSYPEKKLPAQPGGGAESEEFLKADKEFVDSHPLLQKLPINSPYFEVEYISEVHLIIRPKTNNKQRDYDHARAWLEDLRISYGIDVSKIKADYK
ncbi:MAG: hypothetical protein AAB531_04570 [Patescibacteria group bacterium]